MPTSFKRLLSTRRRLRLKAAALAVFFSFLSLLPWAHVLTPGSHGRHGCCHAADESPTGRDHALLADDVNTPAACWVCDSLASLYHPTVLSNLPALVSPFYSSVYFARVPQAPAHSAIFPASRSQAPPANA